jgi:hypothetical protein
VTVESETRLPELEAFRVERILDEPTIRVRHSKTQALNGASRHIRYTESPGLLGFAIDVAFGDTIGITASALLAHSPHVLYTNVVEPILRWTFVEKGFALVHGACIARGDDAYLITARTDTGKTTTILRLLDNVPGWSFLSDDLTLLDSSGRVLMYPKPLTISRHTVSSVRAATLTRRERFTLGTQSRLHSRSGRRFGLLLTRTPLPMASTNAVMQFLVPPPKYDVRRLIPGVSISRQAQLAGSFIIERGPDGEELLEPGGALNTIMDNCDDAYGFPPYASIQEQLCVNAEGDLRPIERGIVSAALSGKWTVLVRSGTRDWWRSIAAHAGPVRIALNHAIRADFAIPEPALTPVIAAGASD